MELSELIDRALAAGIEQVQAAGSPLHPFFLDEEGAIHFLADNAGSADPMAVALQAIRARAPDIRRCALAMDTRITTPDRKRWDAILVIACERDADEGEAWARRYAPRTFFRTRFRPEPPEKVGKAKNFIRVALGEEAPSPIVLRLMQEADLPMLHEWFKRAHVREWWGSEEASLPFGEIRARYRPRVMAEEKVTPYIAMLDGRPIGYAQSYVAMGSGGGWWEGETDPGVRGIDQFLCEPSDLGRGIGTRMVKALVAMLFEDPAVTRIQADPDPRNHRAIGCYGKAGFRALGTIVTPDGAALYMVRDRPARYDEAQRSQTSS